VKFPGTHGTEIALCIKAAAASVPAQKFADFWRELVIFESGEGNMGSEFPILWGNF